MKDWIKKSRSKVYSTPTKDYRELCDDEYYSSFGLKKENEVWDIIETEDGKNKIEYAYERAWENRDFEINKFWTRAAYFWGFIVLIFGAYFNISDKNTDSNFLKLIVICLGIVFSIAWHYVIRGSKRWQENWELHIDKLEDYISGPLYKTIFHKDTFYSVSKINEILSVVIIVVWVALLLNFLNTTNAFPWSENASHRIDLEIIITLIFTAIFSTSIVFGYSRKKYKNKKHVFIRRLPST